MNVGRVMAMHNKLTPTARLLLVHMAWRSLDAGQLLTDADLACLYWGSTAEQSLAVWGMGWTPTRDRHLRKYRAELITAGAVERVGTYRQRPLFLINTGDQPTHAHVDNWVQRRRRAGKETGPVWTG